VAARYSKTRVFPEAGGPGGPPLQLAVSAFATFSAKYPTVQRGNLSMFVIQ
jgi:hypothetical protein